MKMFVKASQADVDSLRILASRSEAHWGYDKGFMHIFDCKFNITREFICENPVYILREQGIPVAFYGLKPTDEGWELEYFYVADHALGEGYGRSMWRHMTEWCQAHQVGKIQFVTSPQAAGFYEKMGAVGNGMVSSGIDGRPIPSFTYKIPGFRG